MEGVAERRGDLGGVVGNAVVRRERERLRAGRGGAVLEGLDDGAGVLLVAQRSANQRARGSVDAELPVEREGPVVERDVDGRAVLEPQRAGEEGEEDCVRGLLVGRAPLPPRRPPPGMHREDAPDEGLAVVDGEPGADEGAEADEAPVPAAPGVEDGRDPGVGGVVDGGLDGRRGLRRSGRGEPVLQRRRRDADRLGEGAEVEGGVLLGQLEDAVAKAVAVAVAGRGGDGGPLWMGR